MVLPKVINPDKVLLPDVLLIAPVDDSPSPFTVIASPILIPPEIFNSAPFAIVVAPVSYTHLTLPTIYSV